MRPAVMKRLPTPALQHYHGNGYNNTHIHKPPTNQVTKLLTLACYMDRFLLRFLKNALPSLFSSLFHLTTLLIHQAIQRRMSGSLTSHELERTWPNLKCCPVCNGPSVFRLMVYETFLIFWSTQWQIQHFPFLFRGTAVLLFSTCFVSTDGRTEALSRDAKVPKTCQSAHRIHLAHYRTRTLRALVDSVTDLQVA
jgi:hypothetical protein